MSKSSENKFNSSHSTLVSSIMASSKLSRKPDSLLVLLVSASIACTLMLDLSSFLTQIGHLSTSSSLAKPAWASWIGEVPTAAELYGDAASDMPTTESFDDDDVEDEELDASATNEYPDSDKDDESYEDGEGE